ncbi:MAG TPA: 2-dehydropantoate 2-reductase N-terminal domain-containing protein, partial [Burkholderiales bacterium]|nr:2-dehydropantoate 2-reductase N-terminal domain-containing protein [Burkholderiales bacterium]
MRICVVGAGAIGGYLAVELAAAGHDVTTIARGPHLEAIRKHGIRLVYRNGTERNARVPATDSFEEAGQHDLVIVGLKAHHIPPVATAIPRLFH